MAQQRKPGRGEFLPPWAIQTTGLGFLAVFAGYWIATGNQSALMVGAASALILLGHYERLTNALRGRMRDLEDDER